MQLQPSEFTRCTWRQRMSTCRAQWNRDAYSGQIAQHVKMELSGARFDSLCKYARPAATAGLVDIFRLGEC